MMSASAPKQSFDVKGFFARGSKTMHLLSEKAPAAFSFFTDPSFRRTSEVFLSATRVKTRFFFQIFAACLYSSRSHSERIGSQCSMMRSGCFLGGINMCTEKEGNNGSCEKVFESNKYRWCGVMDTVGKYEVQS